MASVALPLAASGGERDRMATWDSCRSRGTSDCTATAKMGPALSTVSS